MSAIAGALNIISGGLGILNAAKASKEAAKYKRKAAGVADQNAALYNRAQKTALNYNPQKATADAVAYAAKVRGETARQTLHGLNTDFKNYGGSTTGDTAFNTRVSDTIRGVFDPLAQFTAERKVSETSDAMSILGAALAMGGDVFSNYAALQGQGRADPSGSLSLFASGLDSIFKRGAASPGSGASEQRVTGTGQTALGSRLRMPK